MVVIYLQYTNLIDLSDQFGRLHVHINAVRDVLDLMPQYQLPAVPGHFHFLH